jgi:hypothetical protein
MDFLTQDSPPYISSTTTVMWLVRLMILLTRPMALGI